TPPPGASEALPLPPDRVRTTGVFEREPERLVGGLESGVRPVDVAERPVSTSKPKIIAEVREHAHELLDFGHRFNAVLRELPEQDTQDDRVGPKTTIAHGFRELDGFCEHGLSAGEAAPLPQRLAGARK